MAWLLHFGWDGIIIVCNVFLFRWICSTNHKDIGLAYVLSALFGGVIGTTLPGLVRAEVFESAGRFDVAYASPDPLYNGLITVH